MTPLVTGEIMSGVRFRTFGANGACDWANFARLAPTGRLPRGDELDRPRLDFEQGRQKSHVLAVEVDAHLLR
jgi:hypothetical protein